MSKTPVKTYKPAPSGMYDVRLGKSHEHAGFLYKPSTSRITVNQEILDDMIAAGAVMHVAAA